MTMTPKISRKPLKALLLTMTVGASLAMLPVAPASAFTGAGAIGAHADAGQAATTVLFRGRGYARGYHRGFGRDYGRGYGRGYGYHRGYGYGGTGAAIGAGLAGAAIGVGIGAAVAGSR